MKSHRHASTGHGQVQSLPQTAEPPHEEPGASHCSPLSTCIFPHTASVATCCATHSVSTIVSTVAACPSPVQPVTFPNDATNCADALSRQPLSTATPFLATFE